MKTSGLFYIYIILISFLKGIGLEGNDKSYILIFCLGCVILLLKLLKEKYNKKELLIMVLLISLGLINFVFGKSTKFLFTAITLCGTKNIDIKKTIKYVLITRIITFLLMISLSYFDIIPMNYLDFYRDGEFFKRASFGYGHPNTAHNNFALIVFLLLYCYQEKMNLLKLIIMGFLNYSLYQFTYSRTGFLIISISLFLFIILKKMDIFKKNIFKISKYSYIILLIFTIITSNLYGKYEFMNKLNELFTGRIYYNHYLFEKFNIPLIGSSKYLSYVTIDNGFVSMLFEGGIIIFIVISYFLFKTISKLSMKNKYYEVFLILMFIIYSLTESNFLSASVNISLLLISEYIYNENKEGEMSYEN